MVNFKLGLICLVTVFLFGCASTGLISGSSQRSDFHQAALMGNSDELKRLLPSVANVNAFDSSGFAAIHWAATTSAGQQAEALQVLLQAGADPNLPQQSANMTPLFFASSAEAVNILVDAGADIEYRAIDNSTPLHHAKSSETLRALIARGANKNAVNGMSQTPKQKFEAMIPFFEKNAGLASVVEDYKSMIAILGGTDSKPATLATNGFSQQAQTKNSTSYQRPNLDALVADQHCVMADSVWIYTGKACSDGKAHGKGAALHKEQPLRFEGRIESGEPVEGVLFEADDAIYEGAFNKGVAHGHGVCYYEGVPEECRFFKGQRIDTLHKQRMEFERQQSIAKNKPQAIQPVTQRQVVQQPVETNTLGDAVESELFEQGAKFLFDQLF